MTALRTNLEMTREAVERAYALEASGDATDEQLHHANGLVNYTLRHMFDACLTDMARAAGVREPDHTCHAMIGMENGSPYQHTTFTRSPLTTFVLTELPMDDEEPENFLAHALPVPHSHLVIATPWASPRFIMGVAGLWQHPVTVLAHHADSSFSVIAKDIRA